jgi:hypothetical protein
MESTPQQRSVSAKVTLGCIHIALGLLLFSSRYFGGADLIKWLSDFSASLPIWTLLVLGFVKATYGPGAYVPGTTIILLFFLGRECAVPDTFGWMLLTWLGVLGGMSFSYALGKALSRTPDEKQFDWKDLAFGLHPNLVGIYFFERGFWRRDFVPAFVAFAMFGFLLLGIVCGGVCSFKSLISAQTEEIGVVWGALFVALGIWRIGSALYSR